MIKSTARTHAKNECFALSVNRDEKNKVATKNERTILFT